MKTRTPLTLLLTLVTALFAVPAGPLAQSADEVLLRQAVDLEKAKGDVKGAIEIYRKLAQSSDPKVAEFARQQLRRLQPVTPAPPSDSRERLIATDRTLGGLGGIRFSPDGKRALGLQLASEFEGRGLYLRNLETAAGRVVFSRSPGFFPGFQSFSPDSQRFVAIMPQATPQSVIAEEIRSGRNDDSLAAPGVLVIGAVEAGTPPLAIEIPKMAAMNPFQPFTKPAVWSPDGRSIAVAMPVDPLHTYDVQVIDPSTGRARSLGLRAQGAFDLTWSKDGRELLAHVVPTPGKMGELHLIDVASRVRRAVPLPGTVGTSHHVLRWHPNGEIAVSAVIAPKIADTYLVTVSSGQSRKTCSGELWSLGAAGGPNSTGDMCREITEDGMRQIVWRNATRRLMVIDLKTGKEQALTTGSGAEEFYGWLSPDDRMEVFVSNRDGRWGLYSAELARAPVAAPARLSTFDELPLFTLQRWTTDGFIASVIANGSNILRVDIDSATGLRRRDQTDRLTQDGPISHTPVVSPDGKRIVYWSRQARRFGIAVMDSDGTNERLFFETPPDYPGLMPSWRSNSEILVTVTGAGSPRRVMSVNVDTGATAQVTTLPELPDILGLPQLLAATSEILHLDRSYRSILAKSLTDGRSRLVATFEGDQEVNSFLPSPDGRKLAYSLARRYGSGRACFSPTPEAVSTVNEIARPCEIVVMTLETGQRKVMATTPGQNANTPALIAWSPDSRFLLFGGGRPQILDTTTGTRAPLLLPAQALNWDRTASWSPDGTFIVFSDRSERYEWREWKGVR